MTERTQMPYVSKNMSLQYNLAMKQKQYAYFRYPWTFPCFKRGSLPRSLRKVTFAKCQCHKIEHNILTWLNENRWDDTVYLDKF